MLTVQQIKDTVTDYFKDKPVKEIYLYGSYVRGEASEDSDVDLLVEYDKDKKKLSFSEVLDYKIDLEEIFNKEVDLVEDRLMYPRIKRNIEQDKILIFAKEGEMPIDIEIIEPEKSIYGKHRRDYVVNLEIINTCIEKIFDFTSGATESVFIENNLLKDACMGLFMVIGTHAYKLSPEIKEKFTRAEWAGMTEQENFFDDGVFYKKWNHLWNIINKVLPMLKPKIENIIELLETEQNAKTN